jgi:hypothetical protein
MLTCHLHATPRLRKSGAIFLFSLDSMALTKTTLPFNGQIRYKYTRSIVVVVEEDVNRSSGGKEDKFCR